MSRLGVLSESKSILVVRELGRCEYWPVMKAMRAWTNRRIPSTPDEIWLLEHPPVYTRGVSCRDEPRPPNRGIPLVDSDRGGQITYHGPGQLILYLLLDLRRCGLGVRDFVTLIEQVLIELLRESAVEALIQPGAPGVYVAGSKVAALGLRIRNGCCYHGLSLNVEMDLSPFQSIDPCGTTGLEVTQLRDHGITVDIQVLQQCLLELFVSKLQYTQSIRGESKLPMFSTKAK